MKYFSRDEQLCNFNIHYQKKYSVEYFCARMEEMGIKNIELIAGGQGIVMDHTGIEDTTELKASIAKHGLRVRAVSAESCGYQYQYAAKDPIVRERTFNFFANGIRLCADLGAEVLQANAGWGFWDEPLREGQDRAAEMFRRLCEVAEPLGVMIACETLRPQESLSAYRMDEVKYIFDKVNHPNFKVMLDLCAMGVAGESIQDWFDLFGAENIVHTHFQDGTPYFHMIWGEGKRSLEDDLRTMYEHGYKGMISQEITMAEYQQQPVEYDRKNFAALSEYFY